MLQHYRRTLNVFKTKDQFVGSDDNRFLEMSEEEINSVDVIGPVIDTNEVKENLQTAGKGDNVNNIVEKTSKKKCCKQPNPQQKKPVEKKLTVQKLILTVEEEKILIAALFDSLLNVEKSEQFSALIRHLSTIVYALEKTGGNEKKLIKHTTSQKRQRFEDKVIFTMENDEQRTAAKRLRRIVRAFVNLEATSEDESSSQRGIRQLLKEASGNSFICTLLKALLANKAAVQNPALDKKNKDEQVATALKAAGVALMAPVDGDVDNIVHFVLYYINKDKNIESFKLASRALSVIANHGNESQKGIVFKLVRKLFKGELSNEPSHMEDSIHDKHVVAVLGNPYINNVIIQLVNHYRSNTISWLNEFILGTHLAEPISGKHTISDKFLLKFVNDQSTSRLMLAWLDNTNKEFILRHVFNKPQHIRSLQYSKRGTNFLVKLLEPICTVANVSLEQSALANSILSRMTKPNDDNAENKFTTKKLDILHMSLDHEGNHVAQRVFVQLPLCAAHFPKEAVVHYNYILNAFDEYKPSLSTDEKKLKKKLTEKQKKRKEKGFLMHTGGYHTSVAAKAAAVGISVDSAYTELALSSIGCHCLNALIDAVTDANQILNLNALVERILNPSSVICGLIADQHGGFVVRHLVERVLSLGNNSESLQTIIDAAKEKMKDLIYHEFGNMVVQQLLKALKQSDVREIYENYLKDDIVDMATNRYASHVLVTLFDCADSEMMSDLENQLKSKTLTLAQHINGRFVVDRLLSHSTDVRNVLLDNFAFLAKMKGTQHLLLFVWNSSSESEAKSLIERVIMPNFKDIAKEITGSVTLQRLLQSSQMTDPLEHEARSSLCRLAYASFVEDSVAKTELIKDFYGRFVLRVLMSFVQPNMGDQVQKTDQ